MSNELRFYKHRRRINKRTKIKYLIRVLIGLGVAAIAVLLTIAFGKRESVGDAGMSPTLEHGQVVMVDRVAYNLFSPKKNEIIAFAPNGGERSVVYVRRIIGLPGDRIQILKGKIYINGEEYQDKFTTEPIKLPGLADSEVTVGEGEYFVLGDNRNLSEDSRSEAIGNVKKKDIIGKAWFRAAPIFNMGFI